MSRRRGPEKHLEQGAPISISRRTFIGGTLTSTTLLAGAFNAEATHKSSNCAADVASITQNKESGTHLRIAVVQQDGNPGGVSANRAKALTFARHALDRGADVILFHEELLVGYVKDPRALAEPADGVTTKAFKEVLKGTNSLVIYGLTEKDDDRLYISSVVVSEHGIIAKYRKTHLYPTGQHDLRDEPAVYTPGEALVTFNINGHLCGLMICFDGDFPEVVRTYAEWGCVVLFWMNNRISRSYEEVKALAFSNSMIMATSCCTGNDESGSYCNGGSNITGPYGELITEIWDREGVIVTDVDPSRVNAIRQNNVFFTSRRPALYASQCSQVRGGRK